MSNSELFNRTYACTHFAADRLSTVLGDMERAKTRSNVDHESLLAAAWPDVLHELRKAVAAAESLQRQLVGVPPPKIGN